MKLRAYRVRRGSWVVPFNFDFGPDGWQDDAMLFRRASEAWRWARSWGEITMIKPRQLTPADRALGA